VTEHSINESIVFEGKEGSAMEDPLCQLNVFRATPARRLFYPNARFIDKTKVEKLN
jgi:hypothetical protein